MAGDDIVAADHVRVRWSSVNGGFSTLAGVMTLATKPEIVLAGWIHYLAFDLFVGAWEVRASRRAKIPFLLVAPCLVLLLLESAPGPKYKAALGVANGAGLRASEVANREVSGGGGVAARSVSTGLALVGGFHLQHISATAELVLS